MQPQPQSEVICLMVCFAIIERVKSWFTISCLVSGVKPFLYEIHMTWLKASSKVSY